MFQICQRIPIGEHFQPFHPTKRMSGSHDKILKKHGLTGCNIEGHYLDLGILFGPGVNDTQYMKQCKKNAKKSFKV